MKGFQIELGFMEPKKNIGCEIGPLASLRRKTKKLCGEYPNVTNVLMKNTKKVNLSLKKLQNFFLFQKIKKPLGGTKKHFAIFQKKVNVCL